MEPSEKPPLRIAHVISPRDVFDGHTSDNAGNYGDTKRPDTYHPPLYDYNQPNMAKNNYNQHTHILITLGEGELALGSTGNKETSAQFDLSGRILAAKQTKLMSKSMHELRENFFDANGRVIYIADNETKTSEIVESHVTVVPVIHDDYLKKTNPDNNFKDTDKYYKNGMYGYKFDETYRMPKYEVEPGAKIFDLSDKSPAEVDKILKDIKQNVLPDGTVDYATPEQPIIIIRPGIAGKKPKFAETAERAGDWVVETYVGIKGENIAMTTARYENASAENMPRPEVIKKAYGKAQISLDIVTGMTPEERKAFLSKNSTPLERRLLGREELESFIEEFKKADPEKVKDFFAARRNDSFATSLLLNDNEESNHDRFKEFKDMSNLNYITRNFINSEVTMPMGQTINSMQGVDRLQYDTDNKHPNQITKDEAILLKQALKQLGLEKAEVTYSGEGESQKVSLNFNNQKFNFDKTQNKFVKE